MLIIMRIIIIIITFEEQEKLFAQFISKIKRKLLPRKWRIMPIIYLVIQLKNSCNTTWIIYFNQKNAGTQPINTLLPMFVWRYLKSQSAAPIKYISFYATAANWRIAWNVLRRSIKRLNWLILYGTWLIKSVDAIWFLIKAKHYYQK